MSTYYKMGSLNCFIGHQLGSPMVTIYVLEKPRAQDLLSIQHHCFRSSSMLMYAWKIGRPMNLGTGVSKGWWRHWWQQGRGSQQ